MLRNLLKRYTFRVGLRTVKTTVAVMISMMIVNAYGATSSKLVFAMLGAMSAVRPTFKESVESCLTQIIGVSFGALMGVLLSLLPVHPLVITGIGVILVISLYNMFHIRFAPDLPCLIVAILCITPDIHPVTYAVGRIWDSAIGMGVGLLVNMLVFPYDNSRQIRETVRSLDKELIVFLEEMFDGDDVLPDPDAMETKIDAMGKQLAIFAKQKLFLRRRKQDLQLQSFRRCERKARELVARMEVLSHMEKPGSLDEENRKRLTDADAQIRDTRQPDPTSETDIITNYHVRQILNIRQELLAALEQ